MKKLNQKGLTLVELMAVIAVLAILAVLVTPNIIGSIKKARSGMGETQVNTIISAARNWTADKLDTEHCLICVPDNTGIKDQNDCDTSGGEGCIDLAVCYANGTCEDADVYKERIITIGTLKDGYLDENLKNPKTDKPYSNESYVKITLATSSSQYNYEFVE